jgi:ribulose bisphosphate carboxylase small subunit
MQAETASIYAASCNQTLYWVHSCSCQHKEAYRSYTRTHDFNNLHPAQAAETLIHGPTQNGSLLHANDTLPACTGEEHTLPGQKPVQ